MSIHHKKKHILYNMKWPAEHFAHENKTKIKKIYIFAKVIVGWGMYGIFGVSVLNVDHFAYIYYSHDDVFDGY